MQDLGRGVNTIFEGGNAYNTEQAVSVVIPRKFTDATLVKELTDLKKKIDDISQENATLNDLIKNAEKDKSYWEEEKSNAQVCEKIEKSCFKDSEEIWKDDPFDHRFLEINEIHRKRIFFEIPERINNADKEIKRAENKRSSLRNKIEENANERAKFQNNVKTIESDLRKTPAQRVETRYQQLLEKKNPIFLIANSFNSDSDPNAMIENMIELAEQFGEMESYKNAAALRKECLDLAIKIHYDNMVWQKKILDLSGSATHQEYMALAGEFWDARGYADTEILAKDCENRAAEAQYNLLANAKNNAAEEAEYMNLAKQFRAMNGYKNTAELANECDSQYRMLKERREEQVRKENEERMRREEHEKIKLAERERREEQEKRVREKQERLRIQQEEKELRRFLLIALVVGIVFTAGSLIIGNRDWFNKNTIIGTLLRTTQSSVQQTQNISSAIPGRFPQASERLLTASDLQYLSKKELGIMRNEIFARHGYIFQTPQWKAYFRNQNWYSPRNSDVNSLLTDIELKNIPLIKSYE
jgi:hypothetical protein